MRVEARVKERVVLRVRERAKVIVRYVHQRAERHAVNGRTAKVTVRYVHQRAERHAVNGRRKCAVNGRRMQSKKMGCKDVPVNGRRMQSRKRMGCKDVLTPSATDQTFRCCRRRRALWLCAR